MTSHQFSKVFQEMKTDSQRTCIIRDIHNLTKCLVSAVASSFDLAAYRTNFLLCVHTGCCMILNREKKMTRQIWFAYFPSIFRQVILLAAGAITHCSTWCDKLLLCNQSDAELLVLGISTTSFRFIARRRQREYKKWLISSQWAQDIIAKRRGVNDILSVTPGSGKI